MVTARIQAARLEDFYAEIVKVQCAAHGEFYTSHHAVIRQHATASRSYCELGVNQGATLAAALLAGFRRVVGVDHCLDPIRPFVGLFRAYAEAHNQSFDLREQDSRVGFGKTDFLLIDSCHTVPHLRTELTVHGPNVRGFILAHDTRKHPELAIELERWAQAHGSTVAQRSDCGHGHMLVQLRP